MQAWHPNIFGKLFEMIMILILGGQQPRPAEVPPDIRLCVNHEVPLYLEIDPTALVDAAETIPELKKALAVTADRDGAAAYVAERIGAPPAAVIEAFSGVSRIGFWLLGFGGNNDNFRLLLVIERSDHRNVLQGLISGNTKIPMPDPNTRGRRQQGYVATSYDGVPIHGLRGQGGPHLWATETDGKIAFATDLFALQSFILNNKTAAGRPARQLRARTPGSAVWAEASGPVALNHFVTSLRRHTLDEFALISRFLDFPAWKEASFSVTKDRLNFKVEIDRGSKLTAVLAPPDRPPALLSALPDNCDLAVVVSLKDPNALWTHIRSGIADITTMQGRPERQNRLEEEFLRELGVDIKADIVDNITAGGITVPVLSNGRDLERNFALLAEALDAAKAEQALGRFVARTMRGEAVTPATINGARVWSTRDGKAAIAGTLVMFGPAADGVGAVDAVRGAATGKSSDIAATLTKQFPDATSFAMFNPAILFKGRNVGRLTAGLSFTDGTMKLDVAYNIAALATAFTETVEAAILQGRKARAVTNLRTIAEAAHGYLNDYARYPADFEQMLKYAANDKSLFVSPVSGMPYIFNPGIAGMQVGTIPDRSTTVLAHESPAGLAAHGGGHVLYLDGHAEWFDAAAFRRVVVTEQ